MRKTLAFLPLTAISISAFADTPDRMPVGSASLESRPNRCESISHSSLSDLAAVCCRLCHQGKACGNTCIAREKICHIGKGCACDE